MTRGGVALVFLLAAGAALAPAAPLRLPPSSLAVLVGGEWRVFWESNDAPRLWTSPHPALSAALAWEPIRPGLDVAELRVAGTGEASRLRVIVARIEPRAFRFGLVLRVSPDLSSGTWRIERAASDVALAVNAGQFHGALPWGWLVRNGREVRSPGPGPLSMALVVDSAGDARLVEADSLASRRARGRIAHAFQSYPAVLRGDGEIPPALFGEAPGVDLSHRDARLALGELRDGRLLIVLTRFDAVGDMAGAVPFGPTTPEMAALLGALGARRAMLLDGGISAQLLVRDSSGTTRSWRGFRRVPLGMELR